MTRLRLYLFLILAFTSSFGFAKTTTATISGNWTAGIWDNGAPVSGDIIIIPVGITVTINSIVNLRGVAITTINVYGTIMFSDPAGIFSIAALRLNDGDGDSINVFIGGTIDADTGGEGTGGLIGFGPTWPLYLPSIVVTPVGIFTTDPPGFDPDPITGPSIISGGTLPIELILFEARVNDQYVDLKWITASELNNDYFTIERSKDAEIFEEILTLQGKGTTDVENTYVEKDPNPIIGRSYYRLKQTDFDGTSTYSDLVTVEYEGPAYASLRAFPNPSTGSELTLQLSGVKEPMEVPVRIVSMQGQFVFDGIMQVDESGKSKIEVVFQEPLASGIYVVKAGPTGFLTQKVAVIR